MFTQSGKDDCGKTVVRMALAKLHRDKNYYFQAIDESCNDFYQMRTTLQQHGLKFTSYKINDLGQIEDDKNCFIAQFQQQEMFHFVFVYRKKGQSYYLYDPNFGNMIMSKEEFQTFFTGVILLYEKKVKKEKCQLKQLVPKHITFLYLLFGVLSFCSLFPMLVFQKIAADFTWSLVCLFLSLTFILFINGINIYLRNKMENEIMKNYLLSYPDSADFYRLNSMINLAIKRRSNLTCYSLALLVFFIGLIANNIFYCILILVSLIFEILFLTIEKNKPKVNRNCSLLETKFLQNMKRDSNAFCYYQQVKKKAQKFYLRLILCSLLQFVIALIFILVVMNKSGIYSINFLFFSLGFTFTFSFLTKRWLATFDLKSQLAKEYNALRHPFLTKSC